MNTTVKSSMLAAALALAFGGIAIAQDDGPPPPPPGGGMEMGGVIFGKVKSVDTGARTIKIVTRGRTCTVHVTDNATIDTEKSINASDLKVGDRIQVHGVPTGISASAIIDGDPREVLPPPPGGGPGGPDEQGPGGHGGHRGPHNMADASGKVTSTDPLTISIGNDVSVVVKVGANAKVRKITAEQLSDIKAGDRIVASGDPNDDGRLDVDRVAVNVHMPPPPPGMGGRGPGFGGPRGRGRGGFGGPRMGENGPGGPGGFGGPGGPGGPGMGPDGGGPYGGPGGDFQPGPGPDDAGAPPPPDDGDGQS